MSDPTCACGAVGKLVVAESSGTSADRPSRQLEWRGGRVGIDRLALEKARDGVTACPACQHRAAVFMLVRHARAARRAPDVSGSLIAG